MQSVHGFPPLIGKGGGGLFFDLHKQLDTKKHLLAPLNLYFNKTSLKFKQFSES